MNTQSATSLCRTGNRVSESQGNSRIERTAEWAAGLVDGGQRSGIVFVHRKDEARHLAELLSARLEITVPAITSETPQRERDRHKERLGLGHLPLAVATSAWSTGVDIPQLRWIAFASKQKAPIWAIQAAGRGSRTAEGKDGFDLYDLQCAGSAERQAHLDGYCEEAGVVTSLARRDSPRSETARHREVTGEVPVMTAWYGNPAFWAIVIFSYFVSCVLMLAAGE